MAFEYNKELDDIKWSKSSTSGTFCAMIASYNGGPDKIRVKRVVINRSGDERLFYFSQFNIKKDAQHVPPLVAEAARNLK